jgi:pimeloyl-ACP methyl ester carboxylesterase
LALTDLPLAGLRCPTLIVHGAADTLPARHAEYAAAAIPGAEVHWIENGAHPGLWLGDDAAEQTAVRAVLAAGPDGNLNRLDFQRFVKGARWERLAS